MFSNGRIECIKKDLGYYIIGNNLVNYYDENNKILFSLAKHRAVSIILPNIENTERTGLFLAENTLNKLPKFSYAKETNEIPISQSNREALIGMIE